jgi:transposase-like protein
MLYKRYTDEQRQRILGVAKNGGDWALAAEHNGDVYKIARRWVDQTRRTGVWRPVVAQRGGPDASK